MNALSGDDQECQFKRILPKLWYFPGIFKLLAPETNIFGFSKKSSYSPILSFSQNIPPTPISSIYYDPHLLISVRVLLWPFFRSVGSIFILIWFLVVLYNYHFLIQFEKSFPVIILTRKRTPNLKNQEQSQVNSGCVIKRMGSVYFNPKIMGSVYFNSTGFLTNKCKPDMLI